MSPHPVPTPRPRGGGGAAMAAGPGRSLGPSTSYHNLLKAFTSHQRAVAFYVIHTSLCNVNYLHQGCSPPNLLAVSRQVKKMFLFQAKQGEELWGFRREEKLKKGSGWFACQKPNPYTHVCLSFSDPRILTSSHSLQPPGQPDPESTASPALRLLCSQLPGMLSTATDSQACLCHRTRSIDADHS